MAQSSLGCFYFWGERALYLGPDVPAIPHAHHGGETRVPTRPRQLELRDALPLMAGLAGMVLFFP